VARRHDSEPTIIDYSGAVQTPRNSSKRILDICIQYDIQALAWYGRRQDEECGCMMYAWIIGFDSLCRDSNAHEKSNNKVRYHSGHRADIDSIYTVHAVKYVTP
jgi:hypothetical protein